jgi:hypothetical protein
MVSAGLTDFFQILLFGDFGHLTLASGAGLAFYKATAFIFAHKHVN